MIREEFAEFLKELRKINDNGGDVDAFVKEYENKNVYAYNDACFKRIFADERNLALTKDLVNACLNLVGSERILNAKLTNPYIPGELGYKSSEPDLVLVNERNDGEPCDRISLDVQHEGSDFYNDRLVFYVARHTGNMVASGEIPKLKNLQLISFQFFDAFPWSMSHNYRHTVQLRNQEHLLFFEKQTITIIEVKKFFERASAFAEDNCRLAQWLRAIDTLNRDADFSEFEGDPIFRGLRDAVKLCNFSSGYLLKEGMMSLDTAYEVYVAEERVSKAIARKLLAMGDSVEKICAVTGLYKKQVLKLQEEDSEES
ncbi:PD-(D/E)XK nuclease family transposase [uncultured Fibrobacter sp.]|uniref:PD-(D/E)XK nuclease family transposase n=1 Tax=uncultured Fibrobacter sp. TaxID=261512 RepID=UPI0025CC4A59|nr:PD-(D/E)XK nuclease family transposase [uncultured Fibrobacter sp.]